MISEQELEKYIEQLKKDLEEADYQIYIVGVKRDKYKIWKYFRAYYIKNNKLEQIFFPQYICEKTQKCPHLWDENKGVFVVNGYGVDRTFLLAYELSKYLFNDGYKLKSQFLNYDF